MIQHTQIIQTHPKLPAAAKNPPIVQLQQQVAVPVAVAIAAPVVVAKAPMSVYQTLAHNIELCNNANAVHKSGVRYFMDSVRKLVGGPEFKPVRALKMGLRDKKRLRRAEKLTLELPRMLILELSQLPVMKFKVTLKT